MIPLELISKKLEIQLEIVLRDCNTLQQDLIDAQETHKRMTEEFKKMLKN